MARAMKDSGIEWFSSIPEEWNIVQVKQLFSIGRGRVIATTELSDNGYPVYSSQTKNNGVLGYIDTYDFDRSQLTWTTDGANAGTVFLREGKHNCTNVCGTLLPRTEKNILHFLKYILEYTALYHKRADINGFKIMNNEMAEIKIVLPPIDEQQKIANFLDSKCASIDAVIEKTKASIEEYKKLKQAIITQAVTKGIRPNRKMKDSGIDYLGEMPCDWSVTSISKLFSFLGGYAFQSERFCEKTDFQVIRIGNVKNDKLLLDEKGAYIDEDYSEEAIKSLIKVDDILFTMTGTKGKQDYFFTLVVNEEDVKGRRLYLNQRVGSFRQKKNGILMHYYNYVLKLQKIKDYIFLFETGTANQGNLGIETIKRTKLYVPPFDEQWEIVEYVKNKCEMIDSIIDFKEKTVSEQNELKKSLIYEYVTGKKEVPV